MNLYETIKGQLRLILLHSASEAYPTFNVIHSHESGNEPIETYGVVNILQLRQLGPSSTSTLTNEVYQLTTTTPYEISVQYSFVGPNAGDLAFYTHLRLGNNPLSREYSQQFNLAVLNKSDPRRLPQKRETIWVDQWNFDVRFSLMASYKQDVDIVQRVDYLDHFTNVVVSVPPTP